MLVERIAGRVLPLRRIDPNDIREPSFQGEDKLGERRIILTPSRPINNVFSGDYVAVPWGVRPNTWMPPNIPTGAGLFIQLDTPSGLVFLKWNGEKFVNSTLEILKIGDQWSIAGEVEYQFPNEGNFVFQVFPENYSYVKGAGPLANFKIIRIDEHLDDRGRIGFYTCSVEYEDTPDVYLVE